MSSLEALYAFLAAVAVFVIAARLRPALLGPPWLRGAVFVALVVIGLAIVRRVWGTVEAYLLYLACAIAVSFLVDKALPPRATGRD